jgi:hypothetical protein
VVVEVVEEQHIGQQHLEKALEEELYQCLYPEEARQPAVVPNVQGDDCNDEGQQVEVQQKDH